MKDMERDPIRNGLRHNSHELYALSLDEFDHVVATVAKSPEYSSQQSTWAMLRSGVEAAANYSATSKDLGMLTKLFADLGFSGTKAYIKYYKGQPYVIFKGNFYWHQIWVTKCQSSTNGSREKWCNWCNA
ncbi:hypothetical protein KUV95_08245 [Microbulbifer agarilyticus]|uniref:hypothetical protein n=1 Tax=Microbulbifer agarilyticus TaxID=260552 RepID=UPI001C94936F|nr:hypothetical protein [Microbulbifer agarilyticus]MBY6211544.1 hypothetical protein [Microbulbifer agarilyticus]